MSISGSANSNPSASPSSAALHGWIQRVSNMQVPVFSTTVSDVTSIADSTRSSAQDLSGAIGNDAALTAKLLKIANSPLFSQPGGHAKTINSAVVLLGFDAVRDLAITIGIVDQAKRSLDFVPLIDTLVRAFHSGSQARAIADATAAIRPEEVFLAALLSRLGELVFWASNTPESLALAEHWIDRAPDAETQSQVLGFTLRALTAELVSQWQLRGLLGCVMSARSKDPRESGVLLAHEIAGAGDPQRWLDLSKESLAADAQLADIVSRHAELLKQDVDDSLLQIQAQADKVGQIARRFGVDSRSLPQPSAMATAAGERAADAAEQPATPTHPARQVEIIGQMSQLMQGTVTLDQLLNLALDGIVEGAGFDRVFFALLTPDRASLSIKHRRGELGALPNALTLAANPRLSNALSQAGTLQWQESWVLQGQPPWQAPAQSVLQPVFAGQTCIGLLYADRAERGPDIAPESLAAMVMFVQHVSLGLGVSRSR